MTVVDVSISDLALLKEAGARWRTRQGARVHVRLERERPPEEFYRASKWEELQNQGWPGVAISPEHGGLGMGFAGLSVLLEELGRTLTPVPLRTSSVAALLLQQSPRRLHKETLHRVASGQLVASVAVPENMNGSCEANVQGNRLRISGELRLVEYGSSEALLLLPVTFNRFATPMAAIVAIEPGRRGVQVKPARFMDGFPFASISLQNVDVPLSALILEGDKAVAAINQARWAMIVGLAAEMLGAAEEAAVRTVDYLKIRKQFDQPIGSFQALQHRAAILSCRIALARSAVRWAARELDRSGEDQARAASAAKVACSDALQLAASEMIQMHGGIGMTDEHDAHFFLKRSRVARTLYGSRDQHIDEFAIHSGF